MVKRDAAGDLRIYPTTGREFEPGEARSGDSAGIGFGLRRFLVKSGWSGIKPPLFFKQAGKKIRKKPEKLSPWKKGGGSRGKVRLEPARASKMDSWRGKEFHAKTALELALALALIRSEDLNLKDMARLWGGNIHDLWFEDFIRRLDRGARKPGSRPVKIPRFFPDYKTRSARGHVFASPRLRTREWDCPERGARRYGYVNTR